MTRLGYFLKSLVQIFLTKEAQIFCDFVGSFEKCPSLSKNYFGYFWSNYWGEIGLYLFSHLVTLILRESEICRQAEVKEQSAIKKEIFEQCDRQTNRQTDVTSLGDFLDFGQFFKAFGSN